MNEIIDPVDAKSVHEFIVITRHPVVMGKTALLGSIESDRCARQASEIVFAGPTENRRKAVDFISRSRYLNGQNEIKTDLIPFMGSDFAFIGRDGWYGVETKDQTMPQELLTGLIEKTGLEAA